MQIAPCPKHMVYGPCGGVRPDLSCEMAAARCEFASLTAPISFTRFTDGGQGPVSGRTPRPSPLAHATAEHPWILTDLTTQPFNSGVLGEVVGILAGSCDAVLVGEHQNRPDFSPMLMAQLIAAAGSRAWVTLSCRDRNRLVLEQEIASLQHVGVDAILCVTGDGRAPGIRPDITQVFDLDGTRLAALVAAAGITAVVPESPDAEPVAIRPGRLLEKERAGAQVCVLNHAHSPDAVATFLRRARSLGLSLQVLASVAVYTDEPSAALLQRFPGLEIDPGRVEAVLRARDPVTAGIDAAIDEARELLGVEGVVGINVSGLGSSGGVNAAAQVKAAVGHGVRRAVQRVPR